MGGKDNDGEMRELQPSEVDAVSYSDSGHASDAGSQKSYDDESIKGTIVQRECRETLQGH